MTIATIWTKEEGRTVQKVRDNNAPYRIRNRTGSLISIWSDIDGSIPGNNSLIKRLRPGDTVDWRFDDWRITREVFVARSFIFINQEANSKFILHAVLDPILQSKFTWHSVR